MNYHNTLDYFLSLKLLAEQDINKNDITHLINKFKSSTFKLENLEIYLLCISIIEEIEALLIKNGC